MCTFEGPFGCDPDKGGRSRLGTLGREFEVPPPWTTFSLGNLVLLPVPLNPARLP